MKTIKLDKEREKYHKCKYLIVISEGYALESRFFMCKSFDEKWNGIIVFDNECEMSII